MGKKIEIKKIENPAKCQVTFSKRRRSLIKKAHEISVYCDVDVALLAFSPSGRISKFSNTQRIEEVLERYMNLPPDKRYQNIKNVERKLERLEQLDHHIKGDQSKLLYLDNQIKHLELQIKKSTIDLEILDTNLSDFELNSEEDPSLSQVLWCEKNLQNSLKQITERKKELLTNPPQSYGQFGAQMEMEMERQGHTPFTYNLDRNELNWGRQNPSFTSGLVMQNDPWTSPYSSRVHDTLLQDQMGGANGISVGNGIGTSKNYTHNPTIGDIPSFHNSGCSSLTPQTQIPPTYTPVQPQPMIGNQITTAFPNQELGSMGMCGGNVPFGVEQNQTLNCGQHLNNLNMQNVVAPMSHFNANPNEVNWFASSSYNTTQNMNVTLPSSSERITSPVPFEPFFTNTIANMTTTTTTNDNNDNHNYNGGYDPKGKQPALPSQVDPYPLPDSPTDSFFLSLANELNGTSQAEMGNGDAGTSGNQENCSWELDGLVLAENFNLDDLDIIV